MSIEINERLKKLAELKRRKDETKKAATEAEKAYKDYERETHEFMTAQGIGSMKLEGLGLFVPTERYWSRVIDPEAFKQWAQEEGLAEELVKEAFETGRINQLMKERIENGEDVIPGVEFTPTPYISIRKG